MGKFPKHYDPKLPRGLNGLIDKIENDFVLMQRTIGDMVQFGKKKFNREPSCRTCTKPGCCYQAVYIGIYEALAIARHLRLEGRVTSSYIAELRRKGEEIEAQGRTAWFDSNRPCVFLTPKNRCSIYEVRPIPCRSYFVWSPMEKCQPDYHEDDIISVGNDGIAQQAITQNIQVMRMLGVMVDKNGPMYIGTMPRILATVLEAMDDPEHFVEHIKAQPYPTFKHFGKWVEGDNPYGKALREQQDRERSLGGVVEPVPGPPSDP